LNEYSERLNKLHLIIGEGLCSNIYVIGNNKAFVIDTGECISRGYIHKCYKQ